MAVANMIIRPKSISPVNETCCSSLLIAFGRWAKESEKCLPASVSNLNQRNQGQIKISHRPALKQESVAYSSPEHTFNPELL